MLTPQGEPAAAGEVGELCFRGPGVAPGYIGAAAGAAGFDAGGWLRSGDLGCRDARGYLFLKGPHEGHVHPGGFNVYPAEVEGVIARHPEVLMVAGIGVPDPVLGGWAALLHRRAARQRAARRRRARLLRRTPGRLQGAARGGAARRAADDAGRQDPQGGVARGRRLKHALPVAGGRRRSQEGRPGAAATVPISSSRREPAKISLGLRP